jgi:hypothetical protein
MADLFVRQVTLYSTAAQACREEAGIYQQLLRVMKTSGRTCLLDETLHAFCHCSRCTIAHGDILYSGTTED